PSKVNRALGDQTHGGEPAQTRIVCDLAANSIIGTISRGPRISCLIRGTHTAPPPASASCAPSIPILSKSEFVPPPCARSLPKAGEHASGGGGAFRRRRDSRYATFEKWGRRGQAP